MTGLTVTVWRGPSRVEVEATPTPVPGLAVRYDDHAGAWSVTHIPSGAAVLKLADEPAALDAAVQLGPLADWTLPGSTLRLVPGLDKKVWALARELGCYLLSFADPQISDDQLAVAEGS